jgi:hypothetical protein
MQILIKTTTGGAMHMQLDDEAAKAVLASVRFAARFHSSIATLGRLAEESLATNNYVKTNDRRTEPCR